MATKSKSKKSSLKSKGARYSVTDRKGVTRYYAKGSDAPGYSDTFQGKGTKSQGNAPIAVEGLTSKTSPAAIPNFPTAKDPGDIVGMNNSSLAGMFGDVGLSLDSNKQFVYDPKKSETENAINQSNQTGLQQLMSYIGLQKAPESKVDLYTDTYGVDPEQAQRDFRRGQKDVQNYTSQLNSIVANAQAESLGLEGQGRGITESIIGGQQAQINREAAIKALPIQAQLAASQASLEQATQHLDQLFKLKSEDADAQFNFNNKLIESVYSYANQAQQNVLNAKLSDIKDKRALEQQNLARADEWAKIAMQTGQTSVMAGIANLNPASPTFNQDFARLQGQVRKPVAVSGPSKRDTQVVDGKLIDMQTGEVISQISAGGTLDGKPKTEGQAKAKTFADRMKEAEVVLTESDKFGSAFARGGILPNFLKTEDRQKFEQAQRNFINAVLRRESGAVISEEEFDNASKQYFPQPGDGAGVLTQKRQNRNSVINGFYEEANTLRPVQAGDIIESNGVQYRVAPDGETLIEI